ncbi:threonine/serine exporter family protein [Corynebacterium poyangense]|uniref:Threonine/serine exporter family protein n=1 Tax=Corynebacterium poyangense TaxID=2684405 RepID=A0A7H0SSJ8_9CORY|nr:threonine/serine exporter family protein [Corynebacterium poyangense]MBZ8176441.1 threonine/serine exporter family protein [Corynebacterium poyangense]QNQ91523.1 threonine/serine exporter family protein [Corynebacterium poyangense]
MGVAADAVLRLGMLLMGAGTSGYRVIRGMKRAARALGFDRIDAIVSVTSIECSFHKNNQFRTVVAVQQSPAIDSSRIEALEYITHHMHQRITPAQLNRRLDWIERNVPAPRWSRVVLTLAGACACAGFAVLNHVPWPAVFVVAIAAGAGQFTRSFLGRQHVHQLGGVAAAGTVACLVYWFITFMSPNPAALSGGVVCSVLFLIPGFPLFSAIIDFARFDFYAGLSRLTYAISVIAVATFSVGVVCWVTGMSPEPPHAPAGLMPWWWYAVAAVASFFGIAGFAFIFNSSRRMVLVAATVGMVANIIRLVLVGYTGLPFFPALLAGFLVGCLGAVASRKADLPRITTTVPASVIMVPGAMMFNAVYHVTLDDMSRALANAASAGAVVVAISAGLTLARMMTDKDWTFGHLIDFQKPLTGEPKETW